METATFGGGCFWCTEAIFQRLEGVENVRSGYSGGTVKNPCYREVCHGTTGHAEVIQFEFDPKKIDYEDLVRIHLTTHDPTTLNRQGADTGTQYRSIVLAHNASQKQLANQVVEELQPDFDSEIVTEVIDFEVFYDAEEEHQSYYNRHPQAGYCLAVISPKLGKFRHLYAARLKNE